MLPRFRLAIALLLTAFIGLQIAAAWHSTEHLHEHAHEHEGEVSQHHCVLCLAKSEVSTLGSVPVLALVVALLLLIVRVWEKSPKQTAPLQLFLCRGPPATRC